MLQQQQRAERVAGDRRGARAKRPEINFEIDQGQSVLEEGRVLASRSAKESWLSL